MERHKKHIEGDCKSRLTSFYVNPPRYEHAWWQQAANHLGSSSFITDAIGYATQHLQYLPFGEPKRLLAQSSRIPLKIISADEQTFVDQQNGYDSRYTFSAKEKDDETQYSYFGARYYDSDLSVFLSVDNFSIKYPSLTPYHYCANNPINMIDINGDSLKLENARTDGGDSRGDFTNYLAEKSGWNLTMKGDKVDFASKKDFKAARKEYRKGVGEFKSQLFEAITSDKDQKLKIGAGNNQVDMSSKDFIDFTDLQMAGETGFDLARVGASLEYSKTGDPFGNGPCNIEMKIMMEENMNFRQAIGSSDFRTRRDWSFDRRGSTVTRDNQLEYNYIWPGSIKSAYIIVSHDQNNGGSLSNVRFEIRKQ